MSCEATKLALGGLDNCDEWPSLPKAGFWTPKGFTIPAATAADPAALKTFIQAAMFNVDVTQRIYLFPDFGKITDVSEAKVRVSTSSGKTIPVREGLKRFDIEWYISVCHHRAQYTHRTKGGRFFFIDFSDKSVWTKNSDDDFSGYAISLFDTDSIKFNDGANPSISPAFLELSNPNEINKAIYMADFSFFGELDVLTDVLVTQGTSTTSIIKVTINQLCDNTPVSGLVTADFQVKTTAGAAQTVTAAAVSGSPGTYNLSGTSLATGTVQVLSTSGYESAVTIVTVPHA